MVLVNGLINNIRIQVKKDFEDSKEALNDLHKVLQDNLGLKFKIEPKENP